MFQRSGSINSRRYVVLYSFRPLHSLFHFFKYPNPLLFDFQDAGPMAHPVRPHSYIKVRDSCYLSCLENYDVHVTFGVDKHGSLSFSDRWTTSTQASFLFT